MDKQVGVIGLGAMGGGMARSLRRAGHGVHVFDLRADAAQAFAAEGGTAHTSAAELAAQCDVVVSVVVNAAQTEELLFGAGGVAQAMRQGSVFVMCSTVDPGWSAALETRLAERGLLYLDAPISGGAAKAAAGQITMMTAGRPEAYEQCGALLDAMVVGLRNRDAVSLSAEYCFFTYSASELSRIIFLTCGIAVAFMLAYF